MKIVTTTLLFGLALLSACETTDGMKFRAMVGGGISQLDPDASDTLDGGQGSIRLEVSKQPDYFDNLEIGLRLLGGGGSVSDKELGQKLELDTYTLGGAVVLRPFFDLNEDVRLYAEGFGGYRHSWNKGKLSDSVGTIVRGKFNDGGGLFGLGLGSEFKIDSKSRFILGLEWSRSMLDNNGIDLDVDDFSALIGWSVSF